MSANATLGYTGAAEDPITRGYFLGNGYRLYLPALMRFNAPDSFSPFWLGGVNPYAYCADDPINHIDPSGHMFLPEGAAEFTEIGESSVAGASKREDAPLSVKHAQNAGQPGTSQRLNDAAPSASHVSNVPGRHPDAHAQFKAALKSSANEINQYIDKVRGHIDEIQLQMVHLSADEITFKMIDNIANASINTGKITGIVARHYETLDGIRSSLNNIDAEIELARNDFKPNNRFGITWREEAELQGAIDLARFRVVRLRAGLDRLLTQARAQQGAFATPQP